jgi:hypothetical protein
MFESLQIARDHRERREIMRQRRDEQRAAVARPGQESRKAVRQLMDAGGLGECLLG